MDLTNCLFQWLKTFELKGNCSDPKDLCDGVAISYALAKIAPEHFDTILTKIELSCGASWYLRVSNLRRIFLSIVEFYSEVIDRGIPEKLQPDLEAIARDHDLRHLGHLLQLILGCAINCQQKEKHIAVMTTLSFDIKHGLKLAIDELESFEDNSPGTDTAPASSVSELHSTTNRQYTWEEFNRLQEELSAINSSKEKTIKRCHELESTVEKLKEERQNLKIENEKLSDRISQSMKNTASTESTLRFDSIEHEALFQRQSNQINQLQFELTRMEEQKEDYRIQVEIKEREYHKTLLQIEQLQSKLSEFKHDRDELDRLNYLNDEVIKYKNINDAQKKKLEEFQELKKQIRVLEDRNASLVKQTCELEEEKKSLAVFKGQLELIKKQRDELRQEANKEMFRAEKAEVELKRVHQKNDDLSHDKEKLQMEVEKLKSEVAAYHRADPMNITSIDLDLSPSINGTGNSVATHAIGSSLSPYKNDFSESAEINEKLIRLQFENDNLKKQLQQSNDEKIQLLESQLEDEKSRLARLEAENRANSHRIIELEGQLKESDTAAAASGPTISSEQKDAVEELKAKLNELEQEKSSLITLLDKKTEELQKNEERYNKQVNKAKETYEFLETHIQHNSKSLPDSSKSSSEDTCYWRNLASQRETELEKLKVDFDKSSTFRDMEERMMTVGFHNLSFNLQRKAAEDRIYANNFPNTTFLSRQRQASSKRFIIPPSELVE